MGASAARSRSSGGGQGFSLLFEMNVLFEEYVARMLAQALAGSGARAVAQGGRLFCLERDGKGLFQTRPDILIKRGNIVEQVIDTKWKRVAARVDDAKQGVSHADVYQMMAYAGLYRCPRVALLYPHRHALGPTPLADSYRLDLDGCADRLEVVTIDVGTPTRLRERLRVLCGVEEWYE